LSSAEKFQGEASRLAFFIAAERLNRE